MVLRSGLHAERDVAEHPGAGHSPSRQLPVRFDGIRLVWKGRHRGAPGVDGGALEDIGEAKEAVANVDPLHGPLPLPEIAVFIDERAPLTQPIDGNSWGAWSVDGVLKEIGKVGAPRRHFYTDDIPDIDQATVKLAIFPNAKVVRDSLSAWQKNPAINTIFLFTGPAGLVQTDARDASKSCTTRGASVAEFTGVAGVHLAPPSTNNTRTVIKAVFPLVEEDAFPGIADLRSTFIGDTTAFSPIAWQGDRWHQQLDHQPRVPRRPGRRGVSHRKPARWRRLEHHQRGPPHPGGAVSSSPKRAGCTCSAMGTPPTLSRAGTGCSSTPLG